MKNKGRKHIAHLNGNCKGCLIGLTRDIRKMSSRRHSGNITKFGKKKWTKRIRGYFKSQTKEIM